MNILQEFMGKIIRYIVNRDYLGYRLLNLVNYGVFYEETTGRIFQCVFGKRIYIAHPKHGVPNYSGHNTVEWLCKKIYYGKYLPKTGDVVLDIGTGYGHEIVWLKSVSDPEVICVEPNPEVFVYLSFNLLGVNRVRLLNRFVGGQKYINFPLTTEYAGATSQGADTGIRVEGATLDELIHEYDKVALLKLNIEGGELELLRDSNLSRIDRIIVSCHDFRAERMEGEFFRTFDKVWSILGNAGYHLSRIDCAHYPTPDWAKSVRYWIYATRCED